MKHVLGGKCAVDDQILKKFLHGQMEWFVLLKDVRDYLAHFGAFQFSIKERIPEVLTIEMFRGMSIDEFVKTVDVGFNHLFEFLDEHCADVAVRA